MQLLFFYRARIRASGISELLPFLIASQCAIDVRALDIGPFDKLWWAHHAMLKVLKTEEDSRLLIIEV